MSSSRLILHSTILLVACLLGFLAGRSSVNDARDDAAAVVPGPGRVVGELGDTWSGTETGALSGTGEWRWDEEATEDLFRQPSRGKPSTKIPSRISPPQTARPVSSSQVAASHDEVVKLVDAALPGLSQTERTTWVQEFEGLPAQTIRELLLLKNGLSSRQNGPQSNKTDQHP